MVVLIIFPVILQTDINVIMLSIGEQGGQTDICTPHKQTDRQIDRHQSTHLADIHGVSSKKHPFLSFIIHSNDDQFA